jgi:GNAT superfamily N-acetyltransferase
VVAVAPDGRVVGWMKIVPAGKLKKLYEQRAYRGLPCFGGDRSGVYGVGCFLVDEEERRKGVARGLLGAGIEAARRAGAKQIEAFPRRAEQVSDDQLFTGPFAIFEQQGFRIVNDFAPYPVLRLEL